MERNKIDSVINCVYDECIVPAFICDVGAVQEDSAGLPYFIVTVTDGEVEVGLKMKDGRADAARQRVLHTVRLLHVMTVRDENGEVDLNECYITKMEKTNDYKPSDFGVEEPRLMLADLGNHVGQTVCIAVMVTGIGSAQTAKNGKPYYQLSVSDGKDKAQYNLFDSNHDANMALVGKVIYCTLTVGEKYSNVLKLEECNDYPVSEFIPKAPIDSETMYNEIVETLKAMKCEIAPVAVMLYEDNKDKLLRWAGALKMHHAVYGGLLYHMYRMMQAANKMCDIYPTLNRELLVIGTVIHDIGKLRELDTSESGVTEFMVDGTMSGHVLLGIEMLNDASNDYVAGQEEFEEKHDAKRYAEEYRLVKHMIASHHGQLEFGAIALPATPEAMMLNYLDLIDSRMYSYEDTLNKLDAGTVSDKVYPLGGAHVYKSLLDTEA